MEMQEANHPTLTTEAKSEIWVFPRYSSDTNKEAKYSTKIKSMNIS